MFPLALSSYAPLWDTVGRSLFVDCGLLNRNCFRTALVKGEGMCFFWRGQAANPTEMWSPAVRSLTADS